MKKSFLHKITHLSEKLGEEIEFNKQLIKALNCSNQGIAILNPEGKYIWLNKAHEEMFGYNHKELIGKSWEILYKKEDVDFFHKKVFPIVAEKNKWNGITKGISKNGSTIVSQHVYLTPLSCGGLICTCIKLD